MNNLTAERERCRVKEVLRRSADGSFSKEEIADLYELQDGRCAACTARLSSKYHIDHIVPLANGGTNYIANIQLLCAPCNLSKGARSNDDFLRALRAQKQHEEN